MTRRKTAEERNWKRAYDAGRRGMPMPDDLKGDSQWEEPWEDGHHDAAEAGEFEKKEGPGRVRKGVQKRARKTSTGLKRSASGVVAGLGFTAAALTVFVTGLLVVLLYQFLRSSKALTGILGMVQRAMNWAVSPTAGIWG